VNTWIELEPGRNLIELLQDSLPQILFAQAIQLRDTKSPVLAF
jgi:hypothetical protein